MLLIGSVRVRALIDGLKSFAEKRPKKSNKIDNCLNGWNMSCQSPAAAVVGSIDWYSGSSITSLFSCTIVLKFIRAHVQRSFKCNGIKSIQSFYTYFRAALFLFHAQECIPCCLVYGRISFTNYVIILWPFFLYPVRWFSVCLNFHRSHSLNTFFLPRFVSFERSAK